MLQAQLKVGLWDIARQQKAREQRSSEQIQASDGVPFIPILSER